MSLPGGRENPRVSLVRFFWPYYRRHVGWAVLALATMPVYGAASTAVAALIEPVFADVLLASGTPRLPVALPTADPTAARSPAARSRFSVLAVVDLKAMADRAYQRVKAVAGVDQRSVVFFTPLLLLSVFIVRGVADFWGGYAFQRIGLAIATDVRNDLYGRFLDQSGRFHATYSSGELISRVVNDVGSLQGALSSRLFDIIQQSLTLVLLAVLLLSTDLALAVLVLLAAPVFFLTFFRFGRAVRGSSAESQSLMADVTSVLSEGLRGHPVVKAFSAEDFEHGRFRETTARHLDVSLRLQRIASLSPVMLEILGIFGASLLLIYAGLKIRAGQLTAPLLIQFLATAWLLYDPIRKLNGANLALQQMVAVAHRVADMMSIPNDIGDRPGAMVVKEFRDRIVFDRVSVAYGSRTVLSDVSLEIRRGEVVALVGPSGAGKTTLASLLPRFFDPDEGRVTIDGIDIRDATIRSLRSLIGVVTQHTILFDDTIRNNIAYARPEVPFARVREAATAAFADGFISAQPKRYDTRIGESGARLSGGERQRLAIARAIVKDAPILVLDEATSQLDSESEAIVHDALANLMRGRTVLVIAHHLSTIQRADRIVVIEDGRVVETGRHEELLAAGQVYRRLFELWAAPAGGPDHEC
jgi:subfamily B ATP-binding cassette protein MsbA